MWPWEHLAVGYVLYSLYCHLRYRRAPEGRGVLVVAVATQLPDLIDKTLAWGLHVLPSGHSLGHSLFFAVPVVAIAGALAWRAGEAPVGVAFGLGYLSHLPADVAYPYLAGKQPSLSFLLWPLLPGPSYDPNQSFLAIVSYYFTNYVHDVLSGQLSAYFALQTLFIAAVFLLWLYDGTPLWTELRSMARPKSAPE